MSKLCNPILKMDNLIYKEDASIWTIINIFNEFLFFVLIFYQKKTHAFLYSTKCLLTLDEYYVPKKINEFTTVVYFLSHFAKENTYLD